MEGLEHWGSVFALLSAGIGVVIYYEHRHSALDRRVAKLEWWIKTKDGTIWREEDPPE